MDKLWIEKARAIVGEQGLVLEPSDLEPYAHDEFATGEFSRLPAAAIKPATEEQVAGIVRLCAETGVPVTPRGAGTGLSAGCVPAEGGIVLSLERLGRIVSADPENLSITVQGGVTLERLYQEVEAMGLFFPPHPGDESAMVGGTVATNAGGARAVKYGTIKHFVLGLQVVLADGRLLDLGGKLIKSSTGYNLLDLMIGSEGTLGIITRVTLSLLPPPGSVQTLVAPFETVGKAIGAVPAILRAGIIPFAVEFVEHSVIACAERLLDKRWPARQGTASLMLMLDGPGEEEVLTLAERIGEVMEGRGALDILLAEQKERQAEILQIRSMIYEALRPGTAELFDICVPRSQIAAHVGFIHELEEELGVTLPTYGHAADGNVHTHAMRVAIEDGRLGEEVPGWQESHVKIRRALYEDAISRGGVISGEHGIGLVKREYLAQNLGEEKVELMRAIKKALDPKGILNPGKIFAAWNEA